jgi:hypothetical protein
VNGLNFIPALIGVFGALYMFLELRKARRSVNSLERTNERLRADNAALRAHFEEFPRR